MPVTVLLADDKEVVRSSIRLLLSSDPEIRIVGEASNFLETIKSAVNLEPQVVVLDIHMPDASSVTPQEIKSLFNTLGSRIIAISFWKDEGTQALAQSLGAVTLLDILQRRHQIGHGFRFSSRDGQLLPNQRPTIRLRRLSLAVSRL
jgi:two-component system nitrate/nitrite response regulator NarL